MLPWLTAVSAEEQKITDTVPRSTEDHKLLKFGVTNFSSRIIMGSRLGTATNSRLPKDFGFESWRENFLLHEGQLSRPTLRYPFHTRVTAVAR